MSNELAHARTGARVVASLLHPDMHEDGTYCVAITLNDHGVVGYMSRIVKAQLTLDELCDVLENPGASPFHGAGSERRDED